jgi:hypothetical protein
MVFGSLEKHSKRHQKGQFESIMTHQLQTKTSKVILVEQSQQGGE